MFCPLINNECNEECIYKGNNLDLPFGCDLYDAVKTLQSLQAPGNEIDDRLASIEEKIDDLNYNLELIKRNQAE